MNVSKQSLRQLTDIPSCSGGAPIPIIVADEHKLSLIYYEEEIDPTWDGTTVRMMDQNSTGLAVAVIRFVSPLAHLSGPPNDEAVHGHPLYEFGLRFYSAYEVVNSEWIAEYCRRNRVHKSHKDELFAKHRHFIFTFHDSTFDVIAHNYEVERLADSSVIDAAKLELNGW